MSLAVVAEFSTEAAFRQALTEAEDRRLQVLDAYAPYPLEAHGAIDSVGPRRVRFAATLGGIAAAVAFYLLEWWSAVLAFPINSGGRPAHSWPAFLLAPFEFGIFAAGFVGFIVFLIQSHLPRLHDPIFDTPRFERASQDRFFLALALSEGVEAQAQELGAVSILVAEVEP